MFAISHVRAAFPTPTPDIAMQAAVSTAHATWGLFWATIALDVIGIGAGIAAYMAYREQYRANRVEVDPVMYVTFASPLPNEHEIEDILRVTGGVNSKISTIRYSRGASEERPPLTNVVLEIRNLGRSPAVDVQIPITLRVTSRVVERDDAGRALNVREASIMDHLRVPTVAASGKAYVEVQNDVDGSLEITVGHEAAAIDYRSSPRKVIMVPSLGTSLLILPAMAESSSGGLD